MNKTFDSYSRQNWLDLLSALETIQEEGPPDEDFGICGNVHILRKTFILDTSSMLGVVFLSLGYEDEYTPISYPVGNKWRNRENGLERLHLLLKTIWKIKEYLGLPNYDIYAEDE